MYYIAPIPSQFVDHSGVPYAGGSVSVRYTGDTELAEIYQDAEGVSLLQNPCPLDSHGSWVCFVPAGIALDYVVKDEDGHVVFSFDNVIAASGGDGTGVTKNYVDSHDQELRVMIENLGDDISRKLDKNGDGKDVYVTFEEAQERTSLESKDTLSVLMGKIKKWFSSLKALAFKDKADLTSDVSGILPITSGGTGAGTAVGARDNLDVYSREETEALLAGKIVIVTQLPESGEAGKIYYLQVEENVYDEYIWGYAPGATEKSWILTDRHEVNFDNYKTKQHPYSQPGSATKTLLSISQNANGEIEATFADINLPQQVPRVNIVSPNNTITVSSSTDAQTNTKTFEIDVANGGNSCGWFNSSNIDTVGNEESINVDRFRISEGQTVIGNGLEFVPIEGDVESGVQFGNVYAKAGIYFASVRLTLSWSGAPVNKVCNVAGRQFDFSYNHEERVTTTKLVKLSVRTKMSVDISLESDIPAGLRIWVDRFQIFAINAGTLEIQGIEAVEHDDTLIGTGTKDSPLSVVGYTAGDAIDLNDNIISVKFSKGLELNGNYELQTKIGDGVYCTADWKLTTVEPEENFIDITNEWEFDNGFRLQYNGNIPGSDNDMRILYSPVSDTVKFTSSCRINRSSSISNAWNVMLRYKGVRFYTTYNAPTVDLAPQIGYTPTLGGSTTTIGTSADGTTIKSLLKFAYVGSPNYPEASTGLAIQRFYDDGTPIFGCILQNLVLKVHKMI